MNFHESADYDNNSLYKCICCTKLPSLTSLDVTMRALVPAERFAGFAAQGKLETLSIAKLSGTDKSYLAELADALPVSLKHLTYHSLDSETLGWFADQLALRLINLESIGDASLKVDAELQVFLSHGSSYVVAISFLRTNSFKKSQFRQFTLISALKIRWNNLAPR